MNIPSGCVLDANANCVISVGCDDASNCSGLLQGTYGAPPARVVAARSKKRKRKGPVVIFRKRFSVPAGETRRVKVKLTSAGRRLIRRHKRLKVTVTVLLQHAGGARTKTTSKLVIKRGQNRKRHQPRRRSANRAVVASR